MNTTAPAKSAPAPSHHDHHARKGWWPFTRHFLEMLASMFVGMAVLSAARMGLLALTGAEIPWQPAADALLMAFDMSVGMVVWMRIRGHRWAPCWEMTAAMFVPALGGLALLWAGVVSEHGLMMVEHIAMVPLMLAAMFVRPTEYGLR